MPPYVRASRSCRQNASPRISAASMQSPSCCCRSFGASGAHPPRCASHGMRPISRGVLSPTGGPAGRHRVGVRVGGVTQAGRQPKTMHQSRQGGRHPSVVLLTRWVHHQVCVALNQGVGQVSWLLPTQPRLPHTLYLPPAACTFCWTLPSLLDWHAHSQQQQEQAGSAGGLLRTSSCSGAHSSRTCGWANEHVCPFDLMGIAGPAVWSARGPCGGSLTSPSFTPIPPAAAARAAAAAAAAPGGACRRLALAPLATCSSCHLAPEHGVLVGLHRSAVYTTELPPLYKGA